MPDQQVVQPLKRVVRVATETDMKTLERNKKRADEAFIICKQKIEDRGLEMNLVTAECTFDMNKLLFYFTADGRVDFRELVKDLASVFRTRIELRQIGVRDEAKMIGGLGCCGRELCCSSYLDDFHPVSINMAKDQNLSLNPAKISGVCGRLMCCLKYEHEAYAELQKVTPRQGSVVDTPEGRGKVVSTQMLRGTCKVQLDDSPEHSLTEFQCTQCCMVKGACRNRQNAAAMAEERRKREGSGGCCRSRTQKKDAPKRARLRIRSRSSRVRRASLPRSRLQEMNCPKMLRMSCLRTVKVRRAVAAAEAEDAAASRIAKTVLRNRIPAKNEKKSETAWFRPFLNFPIYLTNCVLPISRDTNLTPKCSHSLQQFRCVLLLRTENVNVCVVCCRNIRMAKPLADYADRYARFQCPRSKGMSQLM